MCMVTDNTQVMSALNSGRSINTTTMGWLRQLFWLAVVHNFDICSVYLPSKDNVICDGLSRLDDAASVSSLKEAGS